MRDALPAAMRTLYNAVRNDTKKGYYSAYPERDDKKLFARGIVKGHTP